MEIYFVYFIRCKENYKNRSASSIFLAVLCVDKTLVLLLLPNECVLQVRVIASRHLSWCRTRRIVDRFTDHVGRKSAYFC